MTFVIYGPAGYARKIDGTAGEAVRKASNYMYVDAMRHNELALELDQNGRVEWAYGFDTILIEKS